MEDKFYQDLELKRKAIYNKSIRLTMLGILLYALGLIFFIVFGAVLEMIALCFSLGILCFLVGSIIIVKNQKKNRIFLNEFKALVVKEIGNKVFGDFSYDPTGKIDKDLINNTGMVKKLDRYNGADYIIGSYKGVSFEVSDVTLEEMDTSSGPDGTVTIYYTPYFTGRWYIYRFSKNFNDTIKIIEGGNLTRPSVTKNLKKVETESLTFNSKFKSYTSDESYFFLSNYATYDGPPISL